MSNFFKFNLKSEKRKTDLHENSNGELVDMRGEFEKYQQLRRSQKELHKIGNIKK